MLAHVDTGTDRPPQTSPDLQTPGPEFPDFAAEPAVTEEAPALSFGSPLTDAAPSPFGAPESEPAPSSFPTMTSPTPASATLTAPPPVKETMAPSPERTEIMESMRDMVLRDTPFIGAMARTRFYRVQPWLKNYKPEEVFYNWIKYMELDDTQRP